METQRLPDESTKAYAAYECYRYLGAERSTAKVGQALGKSKDLMDRWSSKHQWVKRAAEWDADQERQREEARQAEIQKIMSEGYAATHNRVKDLNKLAEKQWEDLQEKDLVWLPDVKSIGSGEFAERVDLIRYNAALSEQFRASLDDIAKEVGARVKKQELSGPNGGPVPVEVDDITSLTSEERAARFAALLHTGRDRASLPITPGGAGA